MRLDRLVNDIVAYERETKALEEKRKDLFNRLNVLVKDEIIPRIEKGQFLPEHYKINEKESAVRAGSTDCCAQAVPFGLYLRLRLVYVHTAKCFTNRDELDEDLRETQNKLSPQLQEIAEDYGLAGIRLYMPDGYL